MKISRNLVLTGWHLLKRAVILDYALVSIVLAMTLQELRRINYILLLRPFLKKNRTLLNCYSFLQKFLLKI